MGWKRFLTCAIVAVAVAAALSRAVVVHAVNPPNDQQLADAKTVYGLMFNELVAALFQEFNETTPGNVPHGKQAISLIFNDANRDMRLIGSFAPLLGGNNDLPADAFEQTALALALEGQGYEAVEQISGQWFYRRSFALSNTLHQNCVLCHTNFTDKFFKQTKNPGQWVGALVQRIPIVTE